LGDIFATIIESGSFEDAVKNLLSDYKSDVATFIVNLVEEIDIDLEEATILSIINDYINNNLTLNDLELLLNDIDSDLGNIFSIIVDADSLKMV
jgi:hypothetical protein